MIVLMKQSKIWMPICPSGGKRSSQTHSGKGHRFLIGVTIHNSLLVLSLSCSHSKISSWFVHGMTNQSPGSILSMLCIFSTSRRCFSIRNVQQQQRCPKVVKKYVDVFLDVIINQDLVHTTVQQILLILTKNFSIFVFVKLSHV